MNFASKSHKGLKKYNNQDYMGHYKSNNGNVFVVCDGVGGLPNGDIASKTAVNSILNTFLDNFNQSEIIVRKAMKNAQNAVKKANPKPLGTTVAMCYFDKDSVHISWCGDSRIYYFRDNKIYWMSIDHNILHDILNKPSRKNKRMFMNPNALNRFFGRDFEVKSDFISFKIKLKDKFLICTDGLTNFLSEIDIINTITKYSTQDASDIMENKLLSKDIGAPDNFTWYIIHIDKLL